MYICGQDSVVHIGLHSVRRIYKRRHGLRPLVSACELTVFRAVNSVSIYFVYSGYEKSVPPVKLAVL